MTSSLVGSEMCIRDSHIPLSGDNKSKPTLYDAKSLDPHDKPEHVPKRKDCLLYTSDAADDM
eukprot:1195450-Prorocentrum_lima.AAC.1